MTKRHFFARQAPRGFANEIDIHSFSLRADRDAWVADHASDGDVNAAYCGAKPCTAREATEILRRRKDDLTMQYNNLIDHC